ncbi:hypothetical protein ACFL3C_01780 [Patescibacteria group bacterium]
MKLLKVIKWSALILSILSFSAFFALTSFKKDETKPVPQEKNGNNSVEEKQPRELEGSDYDKMDCKGIINAFEKQQDKKVQNLPKGLLFNYQSCINKSKPGNSYKEKQEIKKKSEKEKKK